MIPKIPRQLESRLATIVSNNLTDIDDMVDQGNLDGVPAALRTAMTDIARDLWTEFDIRPRNILKQDVTIRDIKVGQQWTDKSGVVYRITWMTDSLGHAVHTSTPEHPAAKLNWITVGPDGGHTGKSTVTGWLRNHYPASTGNN